MAEAPSKILERWRTYWQISQAGEIIRRYFAMNFFDGILTSLGIVLGFFISNLNGIPANRIQIIYIALVTAIAIGISGLTGSHLAESAERKLKVLQMRQVLGLPEDDEEEDEEEEKKSKKADKMTPKFSQNDLMHALGMFEATSSNITKAKSLPLSLKFGLDPEKQKLLGIYEPKVQNQSNSSPHFDTQNNNKPKKLVQEKEKPIYEAAQLFASRIAAFIDGLSPFAGVMIVIIPFLISADPYASNLQFYSSFILTGVVLFTLGGYLAYISKENIIKYGVQMVLSAVLTSAISIALSSLSI